MHSPCKDIRGVEVVTYKVVNLGDVGFARRVNRIPIIMIDPHILAGLPPKPDVPVAQAASPPSAQSLAAASAASKPVAPRTSAEATPASPERLSRKGRKRAKHKR